MLHTYMTRWAVTRCNDMQWYALSMTWHNDWLMQMEPKYAISKIPPIWDAPSIKLVFYVFKNIKVDN